MRLAILLAVLLLAGCAHSKTIVSVYGQVDDVQVELRHELGGRP
jgi:uncharacterized lipoprotein YajG